MSKSKHSKSISPKLAAAINESVETALVSRLTETERAIYLNLVARLDGHKDHNASPAQPAIRRMSNPEAGP